MREISRLSPPVLTALLIPSPPTILGRPTSRLPGLSWIAAAASAAASSVRPVEAGFRQRRYWLLRPSIAHIQLQGGATARLRRRSKVKLARDRTSHNAGSDLRRTLFSRPSCSEDMAGVQRCG